MALAGLLGLLVAVTLLPALLALFGQALFWPRGVAAAERPAGPASRPTMGQRISHLSTHRAVALIVVVVCIAVLLAVPGGPDRNTEEGREQHA